MHFYIRIQVCGVEKIKGHVPAITSLSQGEKKAEETLSQEMAYNTCVLSSLPAVTGSAYPQQLWGSLILPNATVGISQSLGGLVKLRSLGPPWNFDSDGKA